MNQAFGPFALVEDVREMTDLAATGRRGTRLARGRVTTLGHMSGVPSTRFPGESTEYRLARDQLLEAEVELRRAIERVAAQRRALPLGGVVPDDYVFEEAGDGGGSVRFSELFAPGKDTLVIYSFMFPRYSGDPRPGPAVGETAQLPLTESRARPVPRFSTRSTAPRRTSPSSSTSSWSPSQIRTGSVPLRVSAAGATCGCCPPGTTTTTATTTRKRPTAARSRS